MLNLVCTQLTSNGPESVGAQSILRAEFIHREEIMCPLPGSDIPRNKRSSNLKFGHGYNLQASNDGTTYSQEFTVLSFNSKCINCSDDGKDCKIKVSELMSLIFERIQFFARVTFIDKKIS